MQQSTGDSKLDAVALRIAREWRFKAGAVSRVRAPVLFTKSGIKIG
jgi:outer membrane biosynthesis protein TonB